MKSSRFSLLLAIAAAGLLAPGTAVAQSVRAGIEAWQRSDYAAAVAIWRPLAEQGNADAAFNLGQAYRLGRGVAVDLAAARSWLEKAARANHLDAQATLGLLLFDSGSREAALQWLKRAAERGEPRALLVYGTALFNGDGVQRDPVLAYAYVSRSAAQGLEPAKTTLAELDRLIPVDQRQQGVAIALDKAKGKPPQQAQAQVQPKPKPRPDAVPPARQARAEPPKPAVAVTGGKWRIQLGAFSKRASAEALYGKLSGTAPVAGHKAFFVPAGGVVRLQVGPFASRSAASAACATLSRKGQACFPVETR